MAHLYFFRHSNFVVDEFVGCFVSLHGVWRRTKPPIPARVDPRHLKVAAYDTTVRHWWCVFVVVVCSLPDRKHTTVRSPHSLIPAAVRVVVDPQLFLLENRFMCTCCSLASVARTGGFLSLLLFFFLSWHPPDAFGEGDREARHHLSVDGAHHGQRKAERRQAQRDHEEDVDGRRRCRCRRRRALARRPLGGGGGR